MTFTPVVIQSSKATAEPWPNFFGITIEAAAYVELRRSNLERALTQSYAFTASGKLFDQTLATALAEQWTASLDWATASTFPITMSIAAEYPGDAPALAVTAPASDRAVTLSSIALHAVENGRAPLAATHDRKQKAALKLLRAWRSGDAEEQTETLEFLKRALDEERPSGGKLFDEQ